MPADDWWGFSFQHGWVLLDRNIPNNKTNNLIFLRASDWSHYEDTRENWNNTKLYNGAMFYIKSLPKEKQKDALEKYEGIIKNNQKLEVYAKLVGIFEPKYFEVVENKHKAFIKRLNKHIGTLKKSDAGTRSSHCYNCKRKVDNSFDFECSICNWIVCGHCGACGCGYNY